MLNPNCQLQLNQIGKANWYPVKLQSQLPVQKVVKVPTISNVVAIVMTIKWIQ